jgi:hypothetical protein
VSRNLNHEIDAEVIDPRASPDVTGVIPNQLELTFGGVQQVCSAPASGSSG